MEAALWLAEREIAALGADTTLRWKSFHSRKARCFRFISNRVMVTGAGGGLGVHGVQLAKRAGGWVIAQTTSAAKAEALAGYGADAIVVTPRDGDFSADAKAATNGEGVDCVLDTVGTPVFTPTRARWRVADGGC